MPVSPAPLQASVSTRPVRIIPPATASYWVILESGETQGLLYDLLLADLQGANGGDT